MSLLGNAWSPGEPVYQRDSMSYTYTAVLTDPCPPGCWHHVLPVRGYAMRWTAAFPALRFLPDGLHVTGGEPYDDSIEVPW